MKTPPTLTEIYSPASKLTTEAEAAAYIAERVAFLRASNPEEKRTDQELEDLERAQVVAWFAVWDLHNHPRISKLFAWPPELRTPNSEPPV